MDFSPLASRGTQRPLERLSAVAQGPYQFRGIQFKGTGDRSLDPSQLVRNYGNLSMNDAGKLAFLQQPESIQLEQLRGKLKALGQRNRIPESWLPEIRIDSLENMLDLHEGGHYQSFDNIIVLNPRDPAYPSVLDHEFKHFLRSYQITQLFHRMPEHYGKALAEGLLEQVGTQGEMFMPDDLSNPKTMVWIRMNRPDFPEHLWKSIRDTLQITFTAILQTGERLSDEEEQFLHQSFLKRLSSEERQAIENSQFGHAYLALFNACEPVWKEEHLEHGLAYGALDYYFQMEYIRLEQGIKGLGIISTSEASPLKMKELKEGRFNLPASIGSIQDRLELVDRGVIVQGFMAYWATNEEMLARNEHAVGALRNLFQLFPNLKIWAQSRPNKSVGLFTTKENADYRHANEQAPGMNSFVAAIIELKRNNHLLQVKKRFNKVLTAPDTEGAWWEAITLKRTIYDLISRSWLYPGMLRASIPHLKTFQELRADCSDNADDLSVKKQ